MSVSNSASHASWVCTVKSGSNLWNFKLVYGSASFNWAKGLNVCSPVASVYNHDCCRERIRCELGFLKVKLVSIGHPGGDVTLHCRVRHCINIDLARAVVHLVQRLLLNTRGPRFESRNRQNLYRTFAYCQLLFKRHW